MRFEQRKLVVNSFVTTHFSCGLLVWMFHCRRLNNRSNHQVHERALKIINQDYYFPFTEIIRKGRCVSTNWSFPRYDEGNL